MELWRVPGFRPVFVPSSGLGPVFCKLGPTVGRHGRGKDHVAYMSADRQEMAFMPRDIAIYIKGQT